MLKYKPVSISKNAFFFCRWGISLLVWLAFILKSVIILTFVFLIFLTSFIFKVQKSPMIIVYTELIDRFFPSRKEIVNEHAMRWAHFLGVFFSLICLSAVYLSPQFGWMAVLVFAILKSISACGFCPATRLYDCAHNDKCCAFLKK